MMRDATPDDADQAVPLLVEAIDHLALQLAGVSERKAAEPFFRSLFRALDTRYSHRHVRIASSNGSVAAVALAYPGQRELELSAPLGALLRERDPDLVYIHERESRDDEFYLDAIAVAPAFRGMGYAARMIEDACESARLAGFEQIGLLVDLDKSGVKRLYLKQGFVVDGERMLAGHRYEHMQRRIQSR